MSFELFADAHGRIISAVSSNETKQRRRAQLLHYAGPDVQNIFLTLDNVGDNADYCTAVDALNSYFVLKENSTYARHEFRQTQQLNGESVLQFVTRLRQLAKNCCYREETNNNIRDKVLCKCQSDYLRRKLLEEGQTLTLARTIELAEQCEKVDAQMSSLSVATSTASASMHRVFIKAKRGGEKKSTDDSCYRCGNFGHYGCDPKCPAKGKTCKNCGGKNHFAVVCKTKKRKNK